MGYCFSLNKVLENHFDLQPNVFIVNAEADGNKVFFLKSRELVQREMQKSSETLTGKIAMQLMMIGSKG